MKALRNTERYEIDGHMLDCTLANSQANQKTNTCTVQNIQKSQLRPNYPPLLSYGLVLYIVVREEGDDNGEGLFWYTRSVLQSTLQLMGCKAHHAFKVQLLLLSPSQGSVLTDSHTKSIININISLGGLGYSDISSITRSGAGSMMTLSHP